MSECVVRMEMPKCCDDCDANYDCCACGIIGAFWFRNPRYKEFDSSKERLPNCPIICQLPEGHGRLVDADVILQYLREKTAMFDAVDGKMELVSLTIRNDLQGFIKTILETPTIVPEERSETEQV